MGKLTKKQRSKNMRAVKCKGSKIEKMLGKALWNKGYRYRKNNKTVFGKPDFTFRKYKIAVFCDSEFWHGKIERNIERDYRPYYGLSVYNLFTKSCKNKKGTSVGRCFLQSSANILLYQTITSIRTAA